jgi:hypothetical protein
VSAIGELWAARPRVSRKPFVCTGSTVAECRLDAKFVHRADNAADVVAQDLFAGTSFFIVISPLPGATGWYALLCETRAAKAPDLMSGWPASYPQNKPARFRETLSIFCVTIDYLFRSLISDRSTRRFS